MNERKQEPLRNTKMQNQTKGGGNWVIKTNRQALLRMNVNWSGSDDRGTLVGGESQQQNG